MFAQLSSMGVWGIDAYEVRVETSISAGLPLFDVVGLPGAAVKESRDRVRAACRNSGLQFPKGRITVNLAPASVKKEGSVYDLPILLGLLLASGQLQFDPSDCFFAGELSLNGAVRPVKGLLAMAAAAQTAGLHTAFVPAAIAAQAAVIDGLQVFPVETVPALLAHLTGKHPIQPMAPPAYSLHSAGRFPDFADVVGQQKAKQALEVAAAGGHHALLIGPPGSGKSMLAARLPSILPDMTLPEAIQTTTLYSLAGQLPADTPILTTRPFRAPHHTISAPALTGGGKTPTPGELSLAHNGVLFLDELPEFPKNALESLRQPLENGVVHVSRVAGAQSFPCNIIFIAAMNPCPCGYFGHPDQTCVCDAKTVRRYLNRISGPMLDRIDLHVEVAPVQFHELHSAVKRESSAQIRQRVNAARKIQQQRYRNIGISCNARLTPALVRRFCELEPAARSFLQEAFDRLGLSARGHDRILKVARTLADLQGAQNIGRAHVAQAVQLRSLDRKYWPS